MRRCGDFFRDLNGFFGGEIHRKLHAAALNKQSDHACIGRADLQICFNIAFGVDAHGCLGASGFRTLVLAPVALKGKSASGQGWE